jgi:hypothetical protein
MVSEPFILILLAAGHSTFIMHIYVYMLRVSRTLFFMYLSRFGDHGTRSLHYKIAFRMDLLDRHTNDTSIMHIAHDTGLPHTYTTG